MVVEECGKTRWKVLIFLTVLRKKERLFRNRTGRTHPGGGGGMWKDEVEGVNFFLTFLRKKERLFCRRIGHILVVVVECGKTRWKVLIFKNTFLRKKGRLLQ